MSNTTERSINLASEDKSTSQESEASISDEELIIKFIGNSKTKRPEFLPRSDYEAINELANHYHATGPKCASPCKIVKKQVDLWTGDDMRMNRCCTHFENFTYNIARAIYIKLENDLRVTIHPLEFEETLAKESKLIIDFLTTRVAKKKLDWTVELKNEAGRKTYDFLVNEMARAIELAHKYRA